nr:reverse transcriptase domain-containing protein [Tanacetum cinerariifolium]
MKATMAWRCRACDRFAERLLVCSLSFKNNVLNEDEDEDPKDEKFKEEEEPQEEDDIEADIKEDKNKPELTYPYEEVDPLNASSPAFDSELGDVIEVENTIEHEDETIPASFHETSYALVEKKGKAKDEYHGKLILDLGNEVPFSVEQGTAAMEKLVEKLGNAKDKPEYKKLKKELEEARFSNTFLRMQNERTMEVFMDDFSVFGNSFENYVSRLDKMLQRYEDTNLSLNWEKSHFMVKEGIVLGHTISKNGIEVDKAKIDVIAKLPHRTTVK